MLQSGEEECFYIFISSSGFSLLEHGDDDVIKTLLVKPYLRY